MLSDLIHRPNNKRTIQEIIDFVGDDPTLFKELMDAFVNGTSRVSQTTSWAFGHIGEQQPYLINPYHNILLKLVQDKEQHNSVRRNIVRIYQTCDIPEDIEGEMYETALGFILDPKEAIAVKAFSMRICERLATKYKDLIPELLDAIKSVLPNGSPGVRGRGVKTIARLEKVLIVK